MEVIQETCSRYRQGGKPIHLAERLADTDLSSITQYQAAYRGLVQYYLLACTVHRLWRLHRVMEIALVMTLANKFKTNASAIYQKSHHSVATSHGTLTGLEVTVDRGNTKKALVARFGGIELRWQTHTTLEDPPKPVYNSLRSEVVQRLVAQNGE